MYESGAFKSREEMAKVWYNSLFLLSSYSDFEDCALAVIKTAENMKLGSDSIYKITKAFVDTKMLEKKVTVEGTVKSGNKNLAKVEIKAYSYDEKKVIETVKTDENGKYKLELPIGSYRIEYTKRGFKKYEKEIVIKGNTKLNVTLASSNSKNACKTDNCYNVTIYFFGSVDGQTEDSETYAVDAGESLDMDAILNEINKTFGTKMFTRKGDTFYITTGEFPIEFAWYYKDTNTKFDWTKPINEDVEVEMKLFGGLFDNDTLMDLQDTFK